MDQIQTPVFSTLRRRSLRAKDHGKMREEVDTVAKKAPREGKHDERDDPGEVVMVKYEPKIVGLESTGTPESGVTALHDFCLWAALRPPLLKTGAVFLRARNVRLDVVSPIVRPGAKRWDEISCAVLTAESFRSLLWLRYPTNMKLLYGITPR